MFNAVHDHFASTIHRDAEMLYVVGLMALLGAFPRRRPCAWARRVPS